VSDEIGHLSFEDGQLGQKSNNDEYDYPLQGSVAKPYHRVVDLAFGALGKSEQNPVEEKMADKTHHQRSAKQNSQVP
jgi:hypothetical protein